MSSAALATLIVNHLKTDTISPTFFELKTRKSLQLERLFEVAKCKDEAVLALALRRHANDFVNVAEDGKSLLLANHDALMCELDEWDAKCVYLEKSGPSEKLEEAYIRGNLLSGLEETEIEQVIATPQFKASFAFIRFRDAAIACKFVDSYVWKGIENKTYLKLQKTTDLKNRVRRVMLKSKWNKKMIEYISCAALQISRLAAIQSAKREHKRKPLEYQEGVIASFTGAHHETNTMTLKNLIQLVVPVAFVDYEEGSGEGYVRFHSHHDALLAQSYFSRVCITQKHSRDGCGVLNAHQSRHHFRNWKSGSQIANTQGFSIKILDGWEQENYWQDIFDRQACQATEIAKMENMIDGDDDGDGDNAADGLIKSAVMTESVIATKRKKRSKTKASTHVIFESSDHDEEKVRQEKAINSKRKPRHRTLKRPAAEEIELEEASLNDQNVDKNRKRHRNL